jgi:hypothetical protein
MKSRITAMAKARLFTPRFVFTRIALFVVVVNVAIFYQPNWIYKTFYYNPRWVDDAWWSLSYPAYLLVYASMFVLFVELIIRFIKKYA